MSFYFISPFEGVLTDSLSIYGASIRSTLRIDPMDYKNKLERYWQERWPDMMIHEADAISLLTWDLFYDPKKISVGFARLDQDSKTVEMNVFHFEFIIWHRTVIDTIYPLVLHADSSERYMIIKATTTPDALIDWYRTMHD